MKIKEAKEIVESGIGIYGHKYHDAMSTLAEKHQNDVCPAELKKTMIFEYKDFKCEVFYNYVAPYNLGMLPANVWHGVVENKAKWKCALREEIETFEDACKFLLPVFIKVVDRYLQTYKKQGST